MTSFRRSSDMAMECYEMECKREPRRGLGCSARASRCDAMRESKIACRWGRLCEASDEDALERCECQRSRASDEADCGMVECKRVRRRRRRRRRRSKASAEGVPESFEAVTASCKTRGEAGAGAERVASHRNGTGTGACLPTNSRNQGRRAAVPRALNCTALHCTVLCCAVLEKGAGRELDCCVGLLRRARVLFSLSLWLPLALGLLDRRGRVQVQAKAAQMHFDGTALCCAVLPIQISAAKAAKGPRAEGERKRKRTDARPPTLFEMLEWRV
ncbi:hypothetical protein L1887_51839 [Cichorium endivia]|nr:hypothetical protein L1887_51839 [Cichorium endivia]